MIYDWEIKSIQGKGQISGPTVLRNMAVSSRYYQELFEVTADRIEQLEKENNRLSKRLNEYVVDNGVG